MTPSIPGYDILDRLGEGGMALVFRAWSPKRQDFAVIKLLNPEVEDSPMLRQRWDAEAKIGQWIEHPSIARIIDAGEDAAGRAFLAMEYVSGQTVQAIHAALRTRQRRFPPHLAVTITQAVLQALEFVHITNHPQTNQPLGIVHRDLKPANIMITYDGRVKILDFGVARVSLGQLKTQTGTLTGTPAYMSPEQVMADKRIDRRSDIYSWAVVLYELLTGRPLVPDHSERIEQLKAVLTDDPPAVAPAVPELVSTAVDDVLLRALAKEPRDRFGTAGAFWRALESAALPELGIGDADDLGRLVRSLFPGGLEKERLLREMPRARSAPLTDVVDARHSPAISASDDPGPLPPSPADVLPAIPGYAVTGRLGAGGAGVVFTVEHLETGITRALKVLRPELASNADVRRRFGVEAQLGQQLIHPGVVRVIEVGEDPEGRPYMVMERVEGQDLARWLRRLDRAGRRMPPEAAMRISLDVLEVLEYVHRLEGAHGPLGVVHRDLKPSNVMVGPDGQVKVLDFGIARALLGQARTRTGYRSGTEMYMSPEQAMARKDLDHRSDLYSWATVMYELLTGLPLLDTPAAEILPTIVHTPPQNLIRPLEDIVPRLMAPLVRALAKHPEERFSSAAAFAAALANAAPDLVGLNSDALGAMWQAEPPIGTAHGRARPQQNVDNDPADAPTDGLPILPGYRVKKKLDEGGCGQLWLATKRGDATWWVIKTLRPDLARRTDIVRRFEREIRILAELDHPHVVRVQGARRTPAGHLFTVMEFIRGLDFERILYHFRTKNRRLPPDLALRVILDVLSGLHAAHELTDGERLVGVVHRDLSPRNLMVDADGTTKVIDFGLAAAQISPSPQQTRADVGTPRFWSPEQAQGRTGIDRRSDIYAIAVILYEALTGRAVAPFAELGEIRRAVINDRLPPVHEVVTTLPEGLGFAIGRALSKSPEERFASAEEFARALQLAWGERPIRNHAAVADFLGREGPSAYRNAAQQSPVAADAEEHHDNNATFDGPPSDLMQDLLHPPTKLGTSRVRPPRRTRWVFAASGAAFIAVVAALTATVPTQPATPRPEVVAPSAESQPTVVPQVQQRTAPPPLVSPKAPAPKPISNPIRKPARPVRPAPAKTSVAPKPTPPSDSLTRAFEKIARTSRNTLEAIYMIDNLVKTAKNDGRLDAETSAKITACLERKRVGARETVLNECGKLLQR
ncbi:MAG: protein kinase [Myxococcota bacterium]